MNSVKRRHEIVQSALKNGKVMVDDLAAKYGVSTVTIRADLNLLNDKGLLIRARGGAFANRSVAKEHSIGQKCNENLAIKQAIAQEAIKHINEGEAVILDSGSTTAEIALKLHHFRRLVVMTNGFNVAQNLLDAPGIEILMTGGTLRNTSQSFYGRQAENSLRLYHFDKVILGADGFDFYAGITTHFEYEAILNRLMCEVANQVIVVTDSTKFNRNGVHRIRSFNQIDTLITDSGIPQSFADALRNEGVRLITVNPQGDSISERP